MCFSPSAAGLAYSNLVYDWVKAAVMFGVINAVATLDHLDPPQPPKCITMLYVFAETYVETRESLTCVMCHVNITSQITLGFLCDAGKTKNLDTF